MCSIMGERTDLKSYWGHMYVAKYCNFIKTFTFDKSSKKVIYQTKKIKNNDEEIKYLVKPQITQS